MGKTNKRRQRQRKARSKWSDVAKKDNPGTSSRKKKEEYPELPNHTAKNKADTQDPTPKLSVESTPKRSAVESTSKRSVESTSARFREQLVLGFNSPPLNAKKEGAEPVDHIGKVMAESLSDMTFDKLPSIVSTSIESIGIWSPTGLYSTSRSNSVSTSLSSTSEPRSPIKHSILSPGMAHFLGTYDSSLAVQELIPKVPTAQKADGDDFRLPCKHFLRGACTWGDQCRFQHFVQKLYPDRQHVKLLNIPPHMSAVDLKRHIEVMYGVQVIRCVLDPIGNSQEVVLHTIEQADYLKALPTGIYTESGYISVEKYVDTSQCKVFLGGIPHNITEAQLYNDLAAIGVRVVAQPKYFGGERWLYCRDLQLATEEQAKMLVRMRKITIGGRQCHVRMFIPNNKDDVRRIGESKKSHAEHGRYLR